MYGQPDMVQKPEKSSVKATKRVRISPGPVHVTVHFSVEGRVDDDPLGVLRGITKGARRMDDYVAEVVAVARANRFTWAEIGDALGVTRQSAWERFARD